MKELLKLVTDPEKCPYLHDRPARLQYRLVVDMSSKEYSNELSSGWRRFGSAIFRPRCDSCEECVPLRLQCRDFRPSRAQRRVLRKNQDVHTEIGEPGLDDEKMELYHRHHAERAASRGWPTSQTSPSEYLETFVINAAPTLEMRYRLDGKLVGIGYAGVASDSLNSIYYFSEPDTRTRSLGTFNVLSQIEEVIRQGKHILYLGYYVKDCLSMSYKERFRPHELHINGKWTPGEPTTVQETGDKNTD